MQSNDLRGRQIDCSVEGPLVLQFTHHEVQIDPTEAYLAMVEIARAHPDAVIPDGIIQPIRQFFAMQINGDKPPNLTATEAIYAYWAIVETFERLKKKFYLTHGFLTSMDTDQPAKPKGRSWLLSLIPSMRSGSSGNGQPTPRSVSNGSTNS